MIYDKFNVYTILNIRGYKFFYRLRSWNIREGLFMIGEIIKYSDFEVKEGEFPFSTKRGVNIPQIIWNYKNGNKYKLAGVKVDDYGGGYCREVGLYECIAVGDWAKEKIVYESC